jgi:hypothetical protein
VQIDRFLDWYAFLISFCCCIACNLCVLCWVWCHFWNVLVLKSMFTADDECLLFFIAYFIMSWTNFSIISCISLENLNHQCQFLKGVLCPFFKLSSTRTVHKYMTIYIHALFFVAQEQWETKKTTSCTMIILLNVTLAAITLCLLLDYNCWKKLHATFLLHHAWSFVKCYLFSLIGLHATLYSQNKKRFIIFLWLALLTWTCCFIWKKI